MQPPVVRQRIVETIRRAGRPLKVNELIEEIYPKVDTADRDDEYKNAYARIIQSCKLGAASGELVKTAPAEFGIRGVTYYTKSMPAAKKASSKTITVPRAAKPARPAAKVVDKAEWLKRRLEQADAD